MSSNNGIFITVEGIDGCGKTTFAKNLVQQLKFRGCRVIHTREPGGTVNAEKIRGIMLGSDGGPCAPESLLLLATAARIEHVKHTIRPALDKGYIVVCERYIDSTYAYQVTAQGVSETLFDALYRQLDLQIEQPDITFYLEVNPRTAAERRANRNPDAMEINYRDLEFAQKLEKGYDSRCIAQPQFIVLPEDPTLEHRLANIRSWVDAIVEEQNRTSCVTAKAVIEQRSRLARTKAVSTPGSIGDRVKTLFERFTNG